MQNFQQIKTTLNDPKTFGIAAVIIILVFAIAGSRKGIYNKIMPILVIIAAPVIGFFLCNRIKPIADSRLVTFAAYTAAAWVVLLIIKKTGEYVSNWFILGWFNKTGGFVVGALEGLLIVLILRIFI